MFNSRATLREVSKSKAVPLATKQKSMLSKAKLESEVRQALVAAVPS